MAYDEERERRSRVVVDTPTEKREFVESNSMRDPDRSSISAGMVGVLVVMGIALITMLVLFWMSNQNSMDQNANMVAQQPQPTTVVQQPAQQPPVIIQQPAPATQPAPIVVTPPSGGTVAPASTSVNDDMNVQAAIDKRLSDDPALSSLGITATVINGKVTLLGTVKSEALKTQVEQMVRKTKGVKDVDNQITVMSE